MKFSKKQFYWYYSTWLRTKGWYYRIPGKWSRQIDLFLKICEEHDINPFAFLDFMFIRYRGVYPFGIHKIKMRFYNEFLDMGNNKSLLDYEKEDIIKTKQAIEMYKSMGLTKEQIFLLLRGGSPSFNLSSDNKTNYQIFNFVYGATNMQYYYKFFRKIKRQKPNKQALQNNNDVVY